MSPTRTLIEAAGVADGDGMCTPPGCGGAVLIEFEERRRSGQEMGGWRGVGGGGRVVEAGSIERVRAHPGAGDALHRQMSGHVIIPALVNAHTHLDLSGIGAREYDAQKGFAGWLESIRDARDKSAGGVGEVEGKGLEGGGVGGGCRLLNRGGVAGVGDILGGDARVDEALEVMHAWGLEGVSFLEVFGMGSRQEAAIARMRDVLMVERTGPVRVGLQPHAPYSAGLRVFDAAARCGGPIATHLAESLDERRFVRDGEGPLRSMIQGFGLWEDAYLSEIGRGRSPVSHLAETLRSGHWVVVHVNDCSDEEMALLLEAGAHVVYCPRASAYFDHAHELGEHRYREMIGAGINVALGTDSIVCLPPDEADRLSTLDDMRFLHRRDGFDAKTLLAMATVNGARALGLDEARYTLERGEIAGLLAVDVSSTNPNDSPDVRVLESTALPEWLCGGRG